MNAMLIAAYHKPATAMMLTWKLLLCPVLPVVLPTVNTSLKMSLLTLLPVHVILILRSHACPMLPDDLYKRGQSKHNQKVLTCTCAGQAHARLLLHACSSSLFKQVLVCMRTPQGYWIATNASQGAAMAHGAGKG